MRHSRSVVIEAWALSDQRERERLSVSVPSKWRRWLLRLLPQLPWRLLPPLGAWPLSAPLYPRLFLPSGSRVLGRSRHHPSPVQHQPDPVLRPVSGLAGDNPLLSLGFGSGTYEDMFVMIDNGGRIYSMRHGRRVPKLNWRPDQRRVLLRGLTTQLLKHGRIKTTRARASAVKEGSLHKRRQALGFIYEGRGEVWGEEQWVHQNHQDIAQARGHCPGEGTMPPWLTLNWSS